MNSAHIMPSQVLLSFETRSEVSTHNVESVVAVVWNLRCNEFSTHNVKSVAAVVWNS